MRRALLSSVPLLTLVLSASACSYDNGDANRILAPSECSTGTPEKSNIDVGAQIESDVGTGAGFYVEYASGGHWKLTTTCDSTTNGNDCAWDIIISPTSGHTLSNVVGSDLEDGDGIIPSDDQVSSELVAFTGSDADGFTFDSEPGASVSFDVFLENTCAFQYVFWVGDGGLHGGEPTNPLVLVPTGK